MWSAGRCRSAGIPQALLKGEWPQTPRQTWAPHTPLLSSPSLQDSLFQLPHLESRNAPLTTEDCRSSGDCNKGGVTRINMGEPRFGRRTHIEPHANGRVFRISGSLRFGRTDFFFFKTGEFCVAGPPLLLSLTM